ncbi:MAG: ABC transporter substrate-binding protein [Pseudomonadota bacterium]
MPRLKTTLLAGLLASIVTAAPAFADATTEAYVEENASVVLQTLNDPALDDAARTAAFSTYMDTFTDLNRISNFVIGKYARRFDDAELARYRDAFRTYALTVYEVQLDQYRGEAVDVTGSVDRSERDSIVNTLIKRADGEAMDVRWRVMTRDGEYQVVDVALNIDGNLLWLAIEQRAQFISLLDRTNGSADALIEKINSMTAKLMAEKAAGRAPPPTGFAAEEG